MAVATIYYLWFGIGRSRSTMRTDDVGEKEKERKLKSILFPTTSKEFSRRTFISTVISIIRIAIGSFFREESFGLQRTRRRRS
mmetsp:Transcript_34514/g.69727  ORF Transcript_34514/g.69727 Transcript_34514/m.69727 type:complete len:83 (+) Transcript_34514:1194-1442(+)